MPRTEINLSKNTTELIFYKLTTAPDSRQKSNVGFFFCGVTIEHHSHNISINWTVEFDFTDSSLSFTGQIC